MYEGFEQIRRREERLDRALKWMNAKNKVLEICDNPKEVHRESVCFNWQVCGICPKCIERVR